MALQIGFATQYFTLWSVDVTTYPTYVETRNTYHKNLSMTLSKAQEKASIVGATDLEPKEYLKGQSKSFTTRENKYVENEVVVNDKAFGFGRHKGELIADSMDLDYLLWFYGEVEGSTKSNVANRLVEIDGDTYSIDALGGLETPITRIWSMIESSDISIKSCSNFQMRGDNVAQFKFLVEDNDSSDVDAFIDNYPYGANVCVKLEESNLDLVRKEFRGNSYYTPRGKRSFKNTAFSIVSINDDGMYTIKIEE
tara:strand:- start:1192 stop:1950 length:759 start_codon:yes stop_codon:yes gene_type:complete